MTQRLRARDIGPALEGTTVEPREIAASTTHHQLYLGYGTTPVGLLPVRQFAPQITYKTLDLVGYQGDIYRSKGTSTGQAPTLDGYWDKITGTGQGSGGGGGAEVTGLVYDTPAQLALALPPAVAVSLTVLGFYVRGDHPPTRFTRGTTTAPVNNFAYVKDIGGVHWINAEAELNLLTFGCKGDAKKALTGSMSAVTTPDRVTVTGANFTDLDLGKIITVRGATFLDPGPNPEGRLMGTILEIISTTVVRVSFTAVVTVSATVVWWGSDDTAAETKAWRSAATMKKVAYIPPGAFLSINVMTGVNGFSDLHIRGDGPFSRLVHAGLSTNDPGVMFRATGALQLPVKASGPASRAKNILPMSSVTSFAAGQLVEIFDLAQPMHDYGTPYLTTQWAGEIKKIKAVDTTNKILTFETGLNEDYFGSQVVGQETQVRRMDVVSNMRFWDFQLEHTNPSQVAGNYCFLFSRVLDATWHNVNFYQINNVGIRAAHLVHCSTEDSRFINMSGADLYDEFGAYGIMFAGGNWGYLFRGNFMEGRRHFMTTGGPLTGGGTGPQHIYISDCYAEEGRGTFDTHPNGRFITFDNCHGTSGEVNIQSPTTAPGGIFQIRSADTIVSNCTAAGGAPGLCINTASRTKVHNFTGYNNVIGIAIIDAPDVEIVDSHVINPLTAGVWVDKNLLPSMPGLVLRNVEVRGDPVTPFEDPIFGLLEPGAFVFGSNGTGAETGTQFIPNFEDNWVLDDIRAPDATRPFVGGVPHQALYGPFKSGGVKFESMSRDAIFTATPVLTSGVLSMTALPILKGIRISQLVTMFGSPPVGQTNLWMGLYDKNLFPLKVTTDVLTVAPTLNVPYALNLTDPFTTQYDGLYYVAICQAAGTLSTVYGRTISSAAAALDPKYCGNSNAGITGPLSLPALTAGTSTTSASIPVYTAMSSKDPISLTTQHGLGYQIGMLVKVMSTASPTNYFLGRVCYYAGTPDILVVQPYDFAGSGTFASWTITAVAKAIPLTAGTNMLYVGVA